MSDFIEYAGSKLHFSRYGTGMKSMLLFHGFGQNRKAFDPWIEALQADYTIYSFDLFFHGESVWASSHKVEKTDWKKIIYLFLEKEKITEFELAGYSMGGKFVFATIEACPEKVKGVTLIAPDGVKENFWYLLATFPGLQYVFESLIKNPGPFFSFITFLEMMGFIDKFLYRFAKSQMDTEEKRRRVYSSWVYFRPLTFDMGHIADIIKKYKTPLKIFVGKFDRVIPPHTMEDLKITVKHCEFILVESGHSELVEKAIQYIK
ncbi:hypothetical protein WSM22_45350 [Cytophagales bacterium WSM2-2]|nr:hypothetical protein WSM22_45350 [Cytophagales bacterium WSM2-2]